MSIRKEGQYEAVFSDDMVYRYLLKAQWHWAIDPYLSPRLACWIMLNPSTADQDNLDPTLRRCRRFSWDWAFGGMLIANLFALRSTDASKLEQVPDPYGPENDDFIKSAIERADAVIVAWGTNVRRPVVKEQADRVLGMIRSANKLPRCLKVSATGAPCHPLYMPSSLTLIDYPGGQDRCEP